MDVHLRRGDDDLGILELLIELGALDVLVGGGNEGMALTLEPRPQTQFVLGGPEQTGLFFGVVAALTH